MYLAIPREKAAAASSEPQRIAHQNLASPLTPRVSCVRMSSPPNITTVPYKAAAGTALALRSGDNFTVFRIGLLPLRKTHSRSLCENSARKSQQPNQPDTAETILRAPCLLHHNCAVDTAGLRARHLGVACSQT